MNCSVSQKRYALKEAGSRINFKASDNPSAYAKELILALKSLTLSSDIDLAVGAKALVGTLGKFNYFP